MRPARIELATLGLGVPCSIQFELRARTSLLGFYAGFRITGGSLLMPGDRLGAFLVRRVRARWFTTDSRPCALTSYCPRPARLRASPIAVTARSAGRRVLAILAATVPKRVRLDDGRAGIECDHRCSTAGRERSGEAL